MGSNSAAHFADTREVLNWLLGRIKEFSLQGVHHKGMTSALSHVFFVLILLLFCFCFLFCFFFVLFFFFQETSCFRKLQDIWEGGLGRGMCTPPIDTLLDFRFTFSSLRTQAFAGYTTTDWLKNLAPVFQPTKTKTNRTLCTRFPALWESYR